jgi:hypothetical protein
MTIMAPADHSTDLYVLEPTVDAIPTFDTNNIHTDSLQTISTTRTTTTTTTVYNVDVATTTPPLHESRTTSTSWCTILTPQRTNPNDTLFIIAFCLIVSILFALLVDYAMRVHNNMRARREQTRSVPMSKAEKKRAKQARQVARKKMAKQAMREEQRRKEEQKKKEEWWVEE